MRVNISRIIISEENIRRNSFVDFRQCRIMQK